MHIAHRIYLNCGNPQANLRNFHIPLPHNTLRTRLLPLPHLLELIGAAKPVQNMQKVIAVSLVLPYIALNSFYNENKVLVSAPFVIF
jgi:hypothetical protein